MFWNVEDGEEQEINITDNDNADDFIYTNREGDQETWGQLKGAEETYLNISAWPRHLCHQHRRLLATDDGYALKSVEDSAQRIDYEVQALADDDLHDKLESRVLDGPLLQRRCSGEPYPDQHQHPVLPGHPR